MLILKAALGVEGIDALDMAKSEQPVTIKIYGNQRLYNTDKGTYAPLEDLESVVESGANIVVHDARTGDDMTRLVLAKAPLSIENDG